MTNQDIASKVTALVLAGGRGSRIGGKDKGLIKLGGKTLVERVIERIKPQVGALIVSANRNQEQYGRLGCTVVSDQLKDYQGPLAGIAAALPSIKTDYLLVVPCDTPLIPTDLVARLHQAMVDEEADMAIAHDGEQLQHLFMLVRRHAAASIHEFLDEGGRAARDWAAKMFPAVAWFTDQPKALVSVNTPEDLAALEQTGGRG